MILLNLNGASILRKYLSAHYSISNFMSTLCLFLGCSNAALPSLDKCAFHRYRSKCKVEGCYNQVYARQLCVCHGGKKICEFPFCLTTVRTGNFCARHTKKSKPTCTEEGCQLTAYANTKCIRHGGGKACLVDDCTMPVRMGNFCWRHRNRVVSTESEADQTFLLLMEEWIKDDDSLNYQEDEIFNEILDPALPSIDKCSFHRYRSKCKVEGCCNQVYARLLCVSHGGKKSCQFPLCTTPVRSGDYCSKHSLRVECTVCGEMAIPQQTTCWRHGGGKLCSVEECSKPARVKDFCWQHRNRVLPQTYQADAAASPTDDALNYILEEWMKNEPSIDDFEIEQLNWDDTVDAIVPI
ncbi:hypothetical protein THRCLA_00204 [Thraustotheca clavata]|uniref:Uncharacterized protein n=1 Tax=Thraustotheca clavata TaxID=74557 RepID=A0A1W0ACP3_9STRA|nr:hypothetical protein THRCLA_00204 [Thraustotheca clavata]